ncbi:SCO family protein [Shinella sumterensis]|jgi:protein SCO1/2|uniref:SCO family protein n=1 Tax=Shinella sumterensis TaxID=1967501 RepID=A0AA50CTY1_9HYPH|nr:SCO family protein [Shinella sumterensis]WLS01174.1 SCO family protein [Shinella sumterensis]
MASKTLRIVRRVTWATITILAVVLAVLTWTLQSDKDRLSQQSFPLNGPFSMETHTGETFNSTSLAGTAYLAFFGFTHCPDICPTTLFELTDMMKELGPAADNLKVLLISVDPERDSQELLSQYMTAFDPRFVALRGTRQQTDDVVKSFAAFAKKVPLDGGQYTMEHTAGVYVIDADGRFVRLLRMEEPREERMRLLKDVTS